MHLFYIENTQWIDYQSKKILLNEEEAHHAIKVLRVKVGDLVQATDGIGNWFDCKITEVGKRHIILQIEEQKKEYGKRAYKIHIAVAPTKNIKRIEWFLEKATEMGIDEITPIICDHSERREMKAERSNKIITAAVKQSLKAYHPKLNEAVKLKSFLETVSESAKFMAHLVDEEQASLIESYQPQQDVCILIGPEGDFSPQELELALQKGFLAVRMGNERLRTETAAIVACNTIHFIND